MKPIFINKKTLSEVISLSESTIEKLIKIDQFPPPRKIAGRRTGFLVREIEEWAEARPVSDLLPPPNTGAPKPKQKKQAPED